MRRYKLSNIILLATSVIAFLIASAVVLRSFAFEIWVVNGLSMNPTILQSDYILINRLAYRSREPRIGDIIAFTIDMRRFVKRVVGLPGDVVEVRNGLLYRNGEEISDEPYVTFYPDNPNRRSYRPTMVQGDHVFVMGDNRILSIDSKDFGTITYKDIVGKAAFIYYPLKRMRRLE